MARTDIARKVAQKMAGDSPKIKAEADPRVADKSTIIGGDKWVQLKSLVSPEDGVNGYTYSHESRCNGKIVAALPFRKTADGGQVEFLIRKEVTPCWNLTDRCPSSITGGCESEDPREDIVRELKEEASIEVGVDDLIPLGTCRGTKSSDTVYFLYAVDMNGKEGDFSGGEGDGSELEGEAVNEWETLNFGVDNIHDPILGMMILRYLVNNSK